MPDDARPDGGSPALAEHEQLTRLGKYLIERKLGSGGMGTVFLAQDSDLKRTVALKVLAKDKAENPVLVRRFKAEGQAAAYLQHKNIVGVYDSGQIDGFLYIALEFVDGQDVLEIIRKRGVIPAKRSLEIIKQVAEALQHAYEKQIVHRDIKPSNLLIKNDGTVKLADLGLARSIDETLDTSITRVGTTVGTVDYMSPEQARNSKATDIRSDIYSLGCTWYHMLTGVPPYGEGSVTNKLQAHAVAPLPDPRSRNERIPEGVVAVLHRMMAKQAKDRYQTPAELLEDLINPGITRSGLNADVLAALSEPNGRVAQESSSGDIFDSRIPYDSVELDSAVNTLRQDALPGSVVFDEEEETEEPSSSEPAPPHRPRSKGKPGRDPLPARGKAPPREEPPAEDDDQRPGSPRPNRPKSPAGDPGHPSSVPRRQTATERSASVAADSTQSAKSKFKKRKLPPRTEDSAATSEPLRMSLDPDRIRLIVLGGVALVVLAGVAYAVSLLGGSTEDPKLVDGNAAAAPVQEQPVQPVVEPTAPTSPPSPDPTAPMQPVAVGEPNDAATPLRKAAEPIAGAEEFTNLNSAAAREIVPNWLFQVRTAVAADVKPVIVRRPGTPGEGVPTFAAALALLPAGPAVIEFRGDGPFVISPVNLPVRPRLTLQAANGSRPVLVFSASDLKDGEACLRTQGPIALRGLHLVLAATVETAPDTAIFEGSASSLRDCTIQSIGPGAAKTSLIKIKAGSSRDVSGCVLENCHLHSTAGQGVRLIGPAARMLAGNSLFSFDAAPGVSIDATSKGTTAGENREVTLLRSTFVSGKTAFHLQHEGKESPTPVEFVIRRSVFNAAGDASILLDLSAWPASAETLSDKPTAVGVHWKSEQSILAGWGVLARLSVPGDAAKATEFEGDSGWQRFWRQSPAGTRVQTGAPTVPQQYAEVDAAAFASQGSVVTASEPGCRFTTIPGAPSALVERIRALASTNRLPSDFIAYRKPTVTKDFDLSKPAVLNGFLNDSTKCPDGALVRLRGVGKKPIPALQLMNRTLHLEFVQSEGAPLTILPQPGGNAQALITIQGGHVSISNGRFHLPETDRQTYPPSIIDAVGGSVALSNCTLTGPAEQSTRLGPLVRWQPGEGPSGLLIRDSLLTGGKNSLEADLTGRMVEIENSIFAALGDTIVGGLSDASRPGTLTISSSTLAGGQSIVQLAALPAGDRPALTVVMNNSVVLAAPAAAKPVSMLALTSRQDASRIAWWEDGVGYEARAIPAVSILSTPEAGAWTERWGAGHVLRLCKSDLAVLFEHPLENLAKADLSAFRLNPGCESANWSSTGGPLGATGDEIGASSNAPPAAADPAPRIPIRPSPNRPRSVF